MPPPSVAAFAGLLADLTADLRRGTNCLVTADKAWTHPLFAALHERLRAAELRWVYLDGRPDRGESARDEVGVMLVTIAQLRRAVRAPEPPGVLVLPHLDVMAARDGGWTSISREVVPLLYENPSVVLLGFRDPTLALLPVVENLFPRRYAVEQSYREVVAAPPAPVARAVEVVEPPPAQPAPVGAAEPTTHRETVARYPGTLAELAEELGDLRYDSLAEFLRLLAVKLDGDAGRDDARGRARLAAALRAARDRLADAATQIGEAWRISEPHMHDPRG